MTNLKTSKSKVNIGVDVGKWYLDVQIHEKGIYWRDENNQAGIRRILKRLSHFDVRLLVVEATGRYELGLTEAAFKKGIPVCVAKPIAVRKFAGAIDKLAKTDKIDAALIAEYAAVIKPKPTPRKSKNLIAIRDLLSRRRQLMEMRTQELNRLKIMGKAFESSCNRIIKTLASEIQKIECKLARYVEEQPEWESKKDILLSVPGVGNTLVYTLLADLPELGSLSNKQASSLVGVAPFNRDSGLFKGKRRIRGGRTTVRSTLYMATLSATLCNPIIKGFYDHLVCQGKHKKVAITACMRKFITILNAMIRNETKWAN